MKWLRWLSEPNVIYGVVIGIALSVLASFLLTVGVFNYGLVGTLVAALIFIAGAICGSYALRFFQLRALAKNEGNLPNIGKSLLDFGVNTVRLVREEIDYDEFEKQCEQSGSAIRQPAANAIGWITSSYFRFIAFGALFTILGLLVSYAIFWATFLQVNKLEEQLAAEATSKKVDIALNIASNYQLLMDSLIQSIDTDDLVSNSNYTRIESTFYQLKPYYSIDPLTAGLSDKPNSPEQTFLLQYLVSLGIPLPANELTLRGLNAKGLDIRDGNLAKVDLGSSQLVGSHLQEINLRDSRLNNAQFQNSMFNEVDFRDANLSFANLSGSKFIRCKVADAKLTNTDLSGADLSGFIGWKKIDDISKANIAEVTNAPDGFVEWALANGAVETNN